METLGAPSPAEGVQGFEDLLHVVIVVEVSGEEQHESAVVEELDRVGDDLFPRVDDVVPGDAGGRSQS